MTEQAEREESTDSRGQAITVGRYILHRQIARGGMATIHIARLMGDVGFSRIVAAKRLLPELAEDAEFVAMFLDEARVASKVHHRNVVPVLDVVTTGNEVILVQEYVHGAPLHWLLRTARHAKAHVPVNIAVSIACQVLAGLHAAHETVDEVGMPLNIVHRDVSPQNIMVSLDGSARLLDFGVAKATMAAHVTREHTFKGKLAYSSPEQLRGAAVRQSDIYSLAIVLWEMIVGNRMHHTSQAEQEIIAAIMMGNLPTVTEALANEREWIAKDRWRQLETVEPVISKALSVEEHDRYATAAAMETALSDAITPAQPTEVAAWLKSLGREFLEGRERVLAEEEASWRRTATPGRLVPAPSEPRRTAVRSTATAASQPGPSSWRRTRVAALLGGLVGVLGIGLVIGLRSGSHEPRPEPARASTAPLPAATSPSPPPTVTTPMSQPAAAQPAAAQPAPQQPAATAAPAPAVEPAPGGEPLVEHPDSHRASSHVPARSTASVHTPPPSAKAAAKTPPPAPPPPLPPSTAEPAPEAAKTSNCNPPYYFEGPKKIFKPACL